MNPTGLLALWNQNTAKPPTGRVKHTHSFIRHYWAFLEFQNTWSIISVKYQSLKVLNIFCKHDSDTNPLWIQSAVDKIPACKLILKPLSFSFKWEVLFLPHGGRGKKIDNKEAGKLSLLSYLPPCDSLDLRTE